MASKPVILIADDDHDLLKALSLRLQQHQAEVITASDSYTALAKVVENKPDLMILDINMPAGDGFSVQERLKNMEALSNIPVIYMTGDKSQRLEGVAKQFGAVGLFHKPLDIERLVETIRQVLKPKAA